MDGSFFKSISGFTCLILQYMLHRGAFLNTNFIAFDESHPGIKFITSHTQGQYATLRNEATLGNLKDRIKCKHLLESAKIVFFICKAKNSLSFFLFGQVDFSYFEYH